MTEIRFYHLQKQRVEHALPALLSKALSTGKRIIVKGTDETRMQQLNEFLWSYDPNSFLPHGIKKDGFFDNQPIYLTTENDNPNNATILIAIDNVQIAENGQFDLQCIVFDGNHAEQLAQARAQWKVLQENEVQLTYWQQTESGWTEKAL